MFVVCPLLSCETVAMRFLLVRRGLGHPEFTVRVAIKSTRYYGRQIVRIFPRCSPASPSTRNQSRRAPNGLGPHRSKHPPCTKSLPAA